MTDETTSGTWKLRGYDTFDGEYYTLPGEYPDQASAEQAARARLGGLNHTQPVSSSGGQGFGGIQDRVFVVRPDGTAYRVH
jgi:hypothetical protein